MEKKSTSEILTIDHPLMGDIKAKLNDAIMLAVKSAKDMATATIALKMDINAEGGFTEPNENEKYIDPIEFSCSVSTKRKVYDRKGLTMHMTANQNEDGLFVVNTCEDQIGLDELGKDGITSVTVEVKRNDD